MRRGIVGVMATAVMLASGGVASADTVSFPYVAPTTETPNPYAEWTVPAGVTQATFDLYGAQGAGNTGGKGAHVTTTITVTPGTTYRLYVGGAGQQSPSYGYSGPGGAGGAGGYNGGGAGGAVISDDYPSFGGGGATDVREGPGYAIADRLLVAAGGGGRGGDNGETTVGGAGGASDTDGSGVHIDSSGNPNQFFYAYGGKSGSNGGAGGDPQMVVLPPNNDTNSQFNCFGGNAGSASTGGAGASPRNGLCNAGGGGGGGLIGGGGGGSGGNGGGGGGGGSNKIGSGTVLNGDRSGDGQASVTFTPPAPVGVVTIDGPLTPFQSDGSARFKLGTVLEIRVKPRRDGQLITGLSPKVNIVRTGAPTGPQTATVPLNSQGATAGTTMRYSAQFGQYQFYAATRKSQFNGGKDLVPGRFRVDVSDPVFPTPANKVSRAFSIVP